MFGMIADISYLNRVNNELVKEQIWDEATMAAVAFQVTASAVLCLSPSPYKKEKC